MDQDEQAIQSVLAGDSDAFRSLVERHQSAVCATVRALLPRYSEWEDLAQEVFLAVFQHLETFDATKGTFRTWLLAIARNQCRTVRQRPLPARLDALPDLADARLPDAKASEAEWFECLDAALAALPDEQRLAFVLVEMQGLSYQEAADVCEVAVGTVKSRLFRAKEWLKEALLSAASDEKCAARG
ncbi:MAG TPA: RNA polymerase sigma factor [Planctomycetaceae bacterium]|jgi:RNA polymerase sigma-70 factor (ECF subfamily)